MLTDGRRSPPTVNHFIFACSLFRNFVIKTFSRRFKFTMHYIFLCELYIRKHFARMLNSRVIKYAKISENKVLVNNSEFTVYYKSPMSLKAQES